MVHERPNLSSGANLAPETILLFRNAHLIERNVEGDLGVVADGVRLAQELVRAEPLLHANERSVLLQLAKPLAPASLELAELRSRGGAERRQAGLDLVDGRRGGRARGNVRRDGRWQLRLDRVVVLRPRGRGGARGRRSGVGLRRTPPVSFERMRLWGCI